MRSLAAAATALVIVVAACSSGGGPTQSAGTATEAWRTASLRDVVTGDEFRISDLQGKVVAIEAMAIWCVNCRLQQSQAQAAVAQVASPNIVYISLDVDPNERDADLAAYAQREGFMWRFVVASPEVSRSLAATLATRSCRRPRPRSSSSGPTAN